MRRNNHVWVSPRAVHKKSTEEGRDNSVGCLRSSQQWSHEKKCCSLRHPPEPPIFYSDTASARLRPDADKATVPEASTHKPLVLGLKTVCSSPAEYMALQELYKNAAKPWSNVGFDVTLSMHDMT